MTYGRFGVLLGLAILAACAKKPDKIAAVDLGPNVYGQLSCRDLAQARVRTSTNLDNVSAKQRSVARGDAWGVALTTFPIASLLGNDREAQVAIAKGHVQAVRKTQAAKGCR